VSALGHRAHDGGPAHARAHPVPLVDALDESRFGGNATQLGAALRAGLPVPDGVALPAELVDAVAEGLSGAAARCLRAFEMVSGDAVAVRPPRLERTRPAPASRGSTSRASTSPKRRWSTP
jgi:pyruvate,water dikinase